LRDALDVCADERIPLDHVVDHETPHSLSSGVRQRLSFVEGVRLFDSSEVKACAWRRPLTRQ
jgi:hypothetical protein